MTRMRLIAVFALVAIAYVTITTIYLLGARDVADGDAPPPPTDGVLVTLDLDGLRGETYSLETRVSIEPGAALLDSTGELTRAVTVEVRPAANTGTATFAQGTRAGSAPVTLYLDGDIRQWPFDRYEAAGLTVVATVDDGTGRTTVPVAVTVTDSMPSWTTGLIDDGRGPVTITAERTTETVAFAVVLCLVLVALPVLTLVVSVTTLMGRKQFLPPIVTWFAVMLFAVLPIRNLFPGTPPLGSRVDYVVVLWVVFGLAVSLVLYVAAWWRRGP